MNEKHVQKIKTRYEAVLSGWNNSKKAYVKGRVKTFMVQNPSATSDVIILQEELADKDYVDKFPKPLMPAVLVNS